MRKTWVPAISFLELLDVGLDRIEDIEGLFR